MRIASAPHGFIVADFGVFILCLHMGFTRMLWISQATMVLGGTSVLFFLLVLLGLILLGPNLLLISRHHFNDSGFSDFLAIAHMIPTVYEVKLGNISS